MKYKKTQTPKILVIDIETAPITAHVWKCWKTNISLNQIKTDWHLLAFAAKWLGDKPNKIIYMDQRKEKNIENDKKMLTTIWNLLDIADIVLTHNGISFDIKKLNARFILNGFKPLPNIKHIDTLRIARKKFSFTSNKLEYLTDKLCTKYKKMKHGKFPGFVLWKECLKNNKEAWKEMERYNKYDILSLEELYHIMAPWDNSINFNTYSDGHDIVCNCGSKHFQRRGFNITKLGKYQRFQCQDCGSWTRSRLNILSPQKRQTLRI